MIKVGDIVVRAYAWPTLTPGVVIDSHVQSVDVSDTHGISYDECTFTVAWSDGTVSKELDLEIDLIDIVAGDKNAPT